jgi:hypothetical protein
MSVHNKNRIDPLMLKQFSIGDCTGCRVSHPGLWICDSESKKPFPGDFSHINRNTKMKRGKGKILSVVNQKIHKYLNLGFFRS